MDYQLKKENNRIDDMIENFRELSEYLLRPREEPLGKIDEDVEYYTEIIYLLFSITRIQM